MKQIYAIKFSNNATNLCLAGMISMHFWMTSREGFLKNTAQGQVGFKHIQLKEKHTNYAM